jgi:tetratricopeptide (TPR) repeat protein
MTTRRMHLGTLLALLPALAVARTAHAQESQLAQLRTAAASHDPQAVIALGRGLRRAGHYDEAARTLQGAARGATRVDALWEIARVRFDQGNFHTSQAACNALPGGGILQHVCMGRAHLVWHRVALAQREITAAQAIDANNGELKLLVADAHRLAGEVPPAEENYHAAATALPGRADPFLGLAQLYETAQRFDDALANFRHAVETDANDPEANLGLGRFLMRRRHDHAGATPYLRSANENHPRWSPALVAFGEAQLAAGSVTDALTSFQSAIQILANEPGAQSGLGRARLRNNQAAEAEQPLRTAIEQVPNDADARQALAEVLARTNRGEESLEEWNRAIDLVPTDPAPRLRAAEQARSMGQNSLARAYVDRVLSDDQQYAPALLMRADIAFEDNDRTNARQLYQAALNGHGDIDRAHAQQRIAEIDAPQHIRRR